MNDEDLAEGVVISIQSDAVPGETAFAVGQENQL
jgi:hypothetical protein